MKGTDATPEEAVGTVSMCVLRAGADIYGIDIRQIREVLGATLPEPVPLTAEFVAGIVLYRGEVLTTVNLRVLVGLETTGAGGCVLVLDDQELSESFALMVDSLGGVIRIESDASEATPCTLDPRCMALFDGVCRTPSGLLPRLNPRRLSPSWLMKSRLFENRRWTDKGVPRCGR